MTRLNYWNWNKKINLFCILRNYSEWEVGGEVALALLWLLLASMSTIVTEMRGMAWQGSFISCLRPELSSISLLSILYSSLDTYLSISISLLDLSLSLSICLLWMTVCCSSICAAESSSTYIYFWMKDRRFLNFWTQGWNSIFRCSLCWSACSATWRWLVPSSATTGPCSPDSSLRSPSSLLDEIFKYCEA